MWLRGCMILTLPEIINSAQYIYQTMLELSDTEVTVNVCTFEAYFEQAKVNLRFPSLFFVEWKTMNAKNSVAMLGRKRAVNSIVNLEESLTFTTELIYHKRQHKYLKKDTLIHLNLISNSRPDQIKLVGRVVLDLSQVANNQQGLELNNYKLMYCSVEADITFKIKLTKTIQSNLHLSELDKSSFSDLYSFNKKEKFELKDNVSERKVESEKRKIRQKLSDKQENNDKKQTKAPIPPRDKILIKDTPHEGQLMLNSIPVSQRNRPKIKENAKIQEPPQQPVLNDNFNKERNMLQQELGQHKNRIKKLQNDIAAAMKMFQESEEKSEFNKSKLIDSENALTELVNRQNKLKQQYEKQLQKIREQKDKNMEIVKSGYEADIKLLQATLEEQKLKCMTLEHNDKNKEQELNQAKHTIEDLRQKIKNIELLKDELASLNQEVATLKGQKNVLSQQLQAKSQSFEDLAASKAEKAVEQVKQQYQNKMNSLIKELETFQIQNQRLAELTKTNMKIEQPIDEDTLKKYQQLQQQNKKICEQLDMLRQSRASDCDTLVKIKEEKEELQGKYFLLDENHKLQEMELKQLKEERDTLKNMIDQMKQSYKSAMPVDAAPADPNTESIQNLKHELQIQKTKNQQLKHQVTKLEQQLMGYNLEANQLKMYIKSSSKSHEQKQPMSAHSITSYKRQRKQGDPEGVDNVLEIAINSPQQHQDKQNEEIGDIKTDPIRVEDSEQQEQIIEKFIMSADAAVEKLQQKQQPMHVSLNEQQVPEQKQHKQEAKMQALDERKQFSEERSPQVEERHNFNFESMGQNLTPEQINTMMFQSDNHTNHEQEHNALKQQNFRLKQELQELKTQQTQKNAQVQKNSKSKENIIIQNEDALKKFENEKQILIDQINALKDQLSQLVRTEKTVVLLEGGNTNLDNQTVSHHFQMQNMSKMLNEQQQVNSRLQAKVQQLQQHINNVEVENRGPSEQYKNSMREMEDRMSILEEDIKIKDQILNENQRRMEQSYRLKFQLADLKQKCLQLQTALKERDLMINDLEDTKQCLAKQLEEMQINAHNRDEEERKGDFQINLEKVQEEVVEIQQSPVSNEIHALKAEMELLNNQLISLNNQNVELRGKCQNFNNWLLSLQKIRPRAEAAQAPSQTEELRQQIHRTMEQLIETNAKYYELLEANSKQAEGATPAKQQEEAQNQILPFLQVHTVESAQQGSPLDYSRSDIPFDNTPLQTVPIDQNPNSQLDNLHNQIASLKFDLNQEKQEKQELKNKLEQVRNKLVEKQELVEHLREQQEKIGGLPLQSFDDREQIRPRFQDNVTKDQQAGQPSIVQILVGGQAPQTSEKSNWTPNKKMETNTRFETYITQQQLDYLKKEVQMVKEELDSEKKLHGELSEIHKICVKKYELLETRYQNCAEQMQFYQAENEELIKMKKQADSEVYDLRAMLAQVKEPKVQQVIGQAQQQQNIAQLLQFSPEEIKIQNSSISNEKDLKAKIVTLQENVASLELQLQQTNQQNLKLSDKLNRLEELEFMAEQIRAEMEQLKKQNDELRKMRNQYESMIAEKGELTKLIEGHAVWQQEKNELQKKLTVVQSKVIQKETQFAIEKEELEHKLQAIEQQKHQLEKLHSQHINEVQLTPQEENMEPANKQITQQQQNKQALERQMELVEKMAQINQQKLKHLERVAQLQQKMNKIQNDNELKIVQYQQSLILKNNEIEQLKFVVEQLQRDIQQHKNQEGQQPQGDIGLLQEQYNNALMELQTASNDLTSYAQKINNLEIAIAELKGTIETMKEQQGENADIEKLTSQVHLLQQTVNTKTAAIYELQALKKEVEEKLNKLSVEFEQKSNTIEGKDKEIAALNEEKQKIQEKNNEQASKIEEMTAELLSLGQKYTALQKQKDLIGFTTKEKDKTLHILKLKLDQKTTELIQFQQKLQQKQADMIRLHKQYETFKITNQKNQNTILQLVEKQKLLKEAMILVEAQSRKIMQALKDRYASQQQYYAKYLEKQRQCTQLITTTAELTQSISQKDRLLEHELQRVQQLQDELQMFKAAGGEPSQNVAMVQYDKYQQLMNNNDQLMNKNREYLQLLGSKSTVSVENQKLKGEFKKLSTALSEITAQYAQFKNQQEIKVSQLTQQFKSTSEAKQAEASKVTALLQQLSDERSGKIHNQHLFYDGLIKQKNEEIEVLRSKVSQVSNGVDKAGSLEVDGLNEQIMNLNNQILEKQSQIVELKQQLFRKGQNNEGGAVNASQLANLQAQIQHLKKALQRQHNQPHQDLATGGVDNLKHIINQLHIVCQQIKNNFTERNKGQDNLFRVFIQKYDQIQQRFYELNTETSAIQQKARYISKQLQKIKAHIIKSQTKNMKEKQELLTLIKPCENAVGQLVSLSETLSQKENTILQ